MNHPADLSAAELSACYARKDLSPLETVNAVLARIEALDPIYNAFRHVDADGAREQARQSEARWSRGEPLGALDGVPVALKDLLHVAGMPTRMGSLATPDSPAPYDCPAAARLREHGAVLLGKTNTSEFGCRAVTESALAGITRNPWNADHTPLGSSGGAAVASALGFGPLQVATDGGGSTRAPAAACGVFGFKPSYGRVPCYPPAHSGTLFHVGQIARTVTDAALLLNVIGGPDARDWYALPDERRNWLAGLEDGVAGLRIAYSRTLGYVRVDPEVAALVERAVARFAELGAIVEEADPGFEDPRAIMQVLWQAGVARLVEQMPAAQRALLDPALLSTADQGKALGAGAYLEAMDRRMALGMHQRRFHAHYDLLLTPTLAEPAPKVGSGSAPLFCMPFNLTQQPAASMPCGFTASGLPVGLQIVGPQHRDDLVLRAARAFESAAGAHAS
ncbi:amidase [Burkholderiaceae bacterium 16]|nr:amidase [Burkholderiaceae bacterium 16]